MPIDYGRTTQHTVGGIRGLFVKVSFDGRFGNHRFAGQIRLIYLQRNSLEQRTVGRHFLARFQNDDIAHHHILAGYFLYVSVANYLDQRFFVDGVQQVELLVGIVFKEEADTRSQQNGGNDTDGFGVFVLDNRDYQRKQGCHQQYFYDRILKFLQIKFEKRRTFRRSQQVYSMRGAALAHFFIG